MSKRQWGHGYWQGFADGRQTDWDKLWKSFPIHVKISNKIGMWFLKKPSSKIRNLVVSVWSPLDKILAKRASYKKGEARREL